MKLKEFEDVRKRADKESQDEFCANCPDAQGYAATRSGFVRVCQKGCAKLRGLRRAQRMTRVAEHDALLSAALASK